VGGEVDDMVFLMTPASLLAIGYWYENFNQVGDAEVRALLDKGDSSNAYANRARGSK
jgi:predicted phosphoribosyltransferase